MQELSIWDIPQEERPRERLRLYGAQTLSSADLLAIILRTGTKKYPILHMTHELIRRTGGLSGFNDISMNELIAVPGIGPDKAVQILAAIELGKRIFVKTTTEVKGKKTLNFSEPRHCVNYLKTSMKQLKQEHFVVLFLNIKNNLIAKETLFIGTAELAVVHPREIFSRALKHMATSIICVHNHPSGDPTPSNADILITKQLAEVGELMEIPLIDHIIIAGDDYSSLHALGHL